MKAPPYLLRMRVFRPRGALHQMADAEASGADALAADLTVKARISRISLEAVIDRGDGATSRESSPSPPELTPSTILSARVPNSAAEEPADDAAVVEDRSSSPPPDATTPITPSLSAEEGLPSVSESGQAAGGAAAAKKGPRWVWLRKDRPDRPPDATASDEDAAPRSLTSLARWRQPVAAVVIDTPAACAAALGRAWRVLLATLANAFEPSFLE